MTRAGKWARGAGVAVWAVVCAGVVLEVGLRASVSWRPGYYAIVRQSGGEEQRLEYPFGEIRVNARGIADDLPARGRPVVAWVGDSVLYGLGCGEGYRVTEVLEAADPSTDQLNLGVPGFSALDNEWRRALRQAVTWRARSAVWLFNLNDVLPDPDQPLDGPRLVSLPKPPLLQSTYLWTALDASVMTWQIWLYQIAPTEAEPRRRAAVYDATARRIQRVQQAFADKGVPLTVMVMPYEMQISSAAETYYRDHGVLWEEGFPEGSGQQALSDRLGGKIIDLRPAFLSHRTREEIALGEYYVGTEGGRLDWNHLNRNGHAAVARWLVETGWKP